MKVVILRGNLAIIYRSADSQLERLPRLATELVDAKVSVILTIGPPAARVAKTVTRTIPVVFAYGGDPVADGLVDSINRPGGNVTGVTFLPPGLRLRSLIYYAKLYLRQQILACS